jgi:hypothetical protein
MGQPVRVTSRRYDGALCVRLELDRSITGMGHESYRSAPSAERGRPVDMLAARLFETDVVSAVHAFSNIVTITLRPESEGDRSVEALQGVAEDLFIHYRPGVQPTTV